MARPLEIRGVPDRIRNDGWWLTEAAGAGPAARPPLRKAAPVLPSPDGLARTFAALVLLTVLADVSFWRQTPGLSIAVFCLALSAVMLALKPEPPMRRHWVFGLAWALACNLPVIEQVQPLSVGFSLLGLAGILIWVTYGRLASLRSIGRLGAQIMTRGTLLLPRVGACDLLHQGPRLGWVANPLLAPNEPN
jgi:hypothetical protein